MSSLVWYIRKGLLAVSLLVLLVVYTQPFGRTMTTFAQEAPADGNLTAQSPAAGDLADEKFEQEMAAAEQEAELAESKKAAADAPPEMSLIDLYFAGGLLMYPITAMSLIALAFAIERFFALRRRRILPPRLVEELNVMTVNPAGVDPRRAYKLCQQFPSATANVVRAMLMKVGRPHSELEHAVAEATDREATRLYSNVRPISLAVTVSPLLGLLGTVQGMIMAFYDTAYAPVGINKATHLAQGIYVALITTFGGLVVAIPAAILVHFFEGRILARMREVDELAQSLLPQLERYEGKIRVNGQPAGGAALETVPAPPPVDARLQATAARGE